MTLQAAAVPRILTPDQRPRVFVSSTLAEMAPERVAARRAVESLRLIPVMFELGARPHPARALYRAYLAQSHVFIGLYAERYGWVAPGESVSGLADEYLLSGGLPRLVYLRTPAPRREEQLVALLDRIRSDDKVSYKSFGSVEELEQLLRDDLAVMLAERFLLEGGGGPEGASGQAPQAAVVAAPVVRMLPRPLTGLVGREAEVSQVERLMADGARLVTLVGAGGIGKTRVALEVARRAAAVRPDEVAFVPLETVRDPAAFLPAVAAALGIGLDGAPSPAAALAAALRERSHLLVLDNLEQVLGCAADLGALLQACPGLTALATSRAPLRLRGEQQVVLGPLAVPGDGPERDLGGFAAVRLFLERAREVCPGLTIDDPADARAVAELTRRLEGVPLALELAAARSRMLRPPALLARLTSALDLGSGAIDLPERHRTVRATVAWSEELLPARERQLLGELALFEAPFTLADAEAIAGDGVGDVLEGLGGLVEHSLVHPAAGGGGEPRFCLYAAVRAYALERVDGQARGATEGRLVARMAQAVRDLDAGIRSADQARWRADFRLIWPDLRAALRLALQRGDARSAAHLTRAWVGLWLDGRAREVVALMDQALDLADRERPAEHGDVVLGAAGLAFQLGDHQRARALLARLDGDLRLPPEAELPGTLELYRGYLATSEGELGAAEAHLRESCRLLAASGPGGRWIESFGHSGLGSLHALRGDLDAACEEHEASRQLAQRHGNVAVELQGLVFIAAIRVQAGELDEAARLLEAAADLVEAFPYYEGNAYCLEVAGALALARGDVAGAATALGVAGALREVVGARVWPLLAAMRAKLEREVRVAAGDARFDDALARGRAVDPTAMARTLRTLITPS